MKENYWRNPGAELKAAEMSFLAKEEEKEEEEEEPKNGNTKKDKKLYQRDDEQEKEVVRQHKHWENSDLQLSQQPPNSQQQNKQVQKNNNNNNNNNNFFNPPKRYNIDQQQAVDKRNEDESVRRSFKRYAKSRDKSPILLAAPKESPGKKITSNKSASATLRPSSLERSEQAAAAAALKQQQAKKEENEVNLSFCGCGFLGIYHVGVASCFHEYAPQLSMQKISGSSAGALVAVAHICGNLQLAYATTDILRVAIDARARALGPFHPSFDINATVREALERGLPDDVHLKANGKLHVSLTRVYDGENVIISHFDSKEDVIQVLLCSCFIPFWSGLVAPKYKGVTYVDGGFSNNLLILNDKTVTVSPFAGEADICPQDDTLNLLQVSLSNTSFSLTPNNLYRLSHALLPPPPEVLSDLCEQGFADGIRYLQRMNLISCTKCLEIRSSLLVTTNGEDMEEAFNNQAYSMKSSASFTENTHIRLQQQEQKMIEINGNQRRNSVVSTTSQIYCQQQQQQQQSTSNANSGSKSSHSINAGDSFSMFIGDSTSIDDVEMDDDDLDFDLRKQQLLLGFDLMADESEHPEECDECVLIRRRALCDPLPKQFSDRIRDACDTVNKSLSNWIYSHRPIKYLSYLAAPYYLPIDISLALIYRCWKTLPFIRSELIDCVYQIVEFLIGILRRINSKSATSTLLMSPNSASWNEEAIEYEKEMIRHKKTKTTTTTSSHHQLNAASANIATTTMSTCFEASYQTVKITSCHAASAPSLASASSLSLNGSAANVSIGTTKTRNSSTTQLHSLEDTFDSIVDVTSKQEARIFAYYFRDAKNRLQVTEIFDLQRAAELCSSTCCNCCSESGSCKQQQQPLTPGEASSKHHNCCAINQSHHYNNNHRSSLIAQQASCGVESGNSTTSGNSCSSSNITTSSKQALERM